MEWRQQKMGKWIYITRVHRFESKVFEKDHLMSLDAVNSNASMLLTLAIFACTVPSPYPPFPLFPPTPPVILPRPCSTLTHVLVLVLVLVLPGKTPPSSLINSSRWNFALNLTHVIKQKIYDSLSLIYIFFSLSTVYLFIYLFIYLWEKRKRVWKRR